MINRATALSSSPLHISSLSLNPSPKTSTPTAVRRSLRWPSRSLTIRRCSSSLRESSCSLDLPLLPFQLNEVLIPTELKTLHLYEARFLALLEESLLTKKKLFVHFVLDPVLTSRPSPGESFAARYGCLVTIENIERLEIGALVTIRGIGRVSIVDIVQMEPYLRGVIEPMQDEISEYEVDTESKVEELIKSLRTLQLLQVKLKASKDEILQTSIQNSLTWAERVNEDCDQCFIPDLDERLSFAALQPVSGFSQSELHLLQKEKLRAMDTRDTLQRLKIGIKFVKENMSIVAAKLAIQSLEM